MCIHEQYANDISLKQRFAVILAVLTNEHTDCQKTLEIRTLTSEAISTCDAREVS